MNPTLPPEGVGRILLVNGGRKQLKKLTQVLHAVAGRQVDTRQSLEGAPLAGYALILVDYDALSPADRQWLIDAAPKFTADARLLVLSDGQCKDDFAALFGNRLLTNLVARNEDVDSWELIVTMGKLLRRDIFGIEKYFSWGTEPKVMRVSRSSEKPQVVEAAEAFAQGIGVDPRLASLFCTVADEFFTNAIFNAPVDANGKSRHGHLARESEVVLAPGEEVVLKFSCDGTKLGISAADPFGSLTKERLLFYLSKCFRKGEDQVDDKAGGAGLGLYYVFECLSHFVVNISPSKKTEMIGLIDVRGSFKDFASRNKSFNVFMEG